MYLILFDQWIEIILSYNIDITVFKLKYCMNFILGACGYFKSSRNKIYKELLFIQ